jgi:ribosomal protein S18 acetylase RimI-like enzyme
VIEVRPATEADNGILALLLEAARSESARYRGHIDPDNRPHTAVVACVVGEVVGVLFFRDDDSIRTISVVHVDESARNVGVGDALVGFVLRNASESGCTHIRSTALPGDRATKNLFERNGMVARAIQVERNLT